MLKYLGTTSPFYAFASELLKEAKKDGEPTFYAEDEVSETDNSFIVTIELPGVKKESVTIEFADDVLSITGTKDKTDGGRISESARSYGKFSKRYTVRSQIDSDSIAATFVDGVLSITIPKADSAKARKININSI